MMPVFKNLLELEAPKTLLVGFIVIFWGDGEVVIWVEVGELTDWLDSLFEEAIGLGVAVGFGEASGVGENCAVIKTEAVVSDHCAEVSDSEVYLPTLK